MAFARRLPFQQNREWRKIRTALQQIRLTGSSKSYPTQVLAVAALCIAAYACCLNNGFISDDYENLRLAEGLKSDFWYLFKSPPLNFRMTSFLAYAMLDRLFAQHYEFFYTANIFLHFINCLLLWKLLLVLGRHAGEAYLAAILFAVFQGPQEGVMWVAALNETLLGSFVLSTFVLWFRGHYFISAISLLLALFSKESAAIADSFEKRDRKSTRLNSSHLGISYAIF